MSESAHAPLPRTPAPAALEALRRPSAAHRPMRPQALAWDGDWREPGPPAGATAAHGCPAATGRPAAGPIVHLLAGGGTAARPAIGQGLLHHVDVLPHRVGQLRLLLRAPLIDARGRRLRCGGHRAQRGWQNWRWLRQCGWKGKWRPLPDRQRHRLRLHLRCSQVDRWRTALLLPPRAQAADSGHESQSRQRRRQRCNASPGDPLLAVAVWLERGNCHHDSANAGHRPCPKLIWRTGSTRMRSHPPFLRCRR